MAGRQYPPVTDETLPAIIEAEVANAVGHWDGTLAFERKMELDYYNGRPFGNEKEGESQVISTDVADTIEGVLPSLLRIFTASDDAVRFDPVGPEDEEQAKQRTELSNYVFYKQNNGFLILYEWFKDALLQKNGIVKYWWEKSEAVTQESYEGLTEGEYRMLVQQDGAEIIKKSNYNDPTAESQIEQFKQALPAHVQQVTQGNQQAAKQMLAMGLEQIAKQPIPQLYDCTVKITKDTSKCCIETVPPEEFGISAKHTCVSIQDTPFCYQRGRRTISELREDGCPDDILDRLSPAQEPDVSPEALARDRFMDISQYRDMKAPDPSMNEIWVTECFIRIDYDNDGVSELRHIIMPGREVWINEPAEHINFAALTPVIMPHRWVGRSVAELVMDIQFNKSVLWRQMFNNLYLTNNPRKAVLASAGGIVQANLDDLLQSRPGGIVREYAPNAVRDLETPFVAGASFPMLEYMDSVKENRTGVTRYNQGTDANSLNKTARGINQIMNAGQQRIDLIARIFAETGVKDLFRGIAYMLSKYPTKAMAIRIRNKWVDIDPRDWKNEYDMTVNVGLGTGNRDEQLQHFQLLHADMIELMKEGRGYMISDENLWNLYTRRAEAMGFKHPELFITDPRNVDPKMKQGKPDPTIIKAQMEQQTDHAKLQFAQWKEQANAQMLQAVEKIKGEIALRIAAMDNQTKEKIATGQMTHQAQLEVFKGRKDLNSDFERWKTELDNATKIAVAQISAKTAENNAALSAATKVADQTIIDTSGSSIGGIKETLGAVSKAHEGMAAALSGTGKQVADSMGAVTQLLAQLTAAHQQGAADSAKPRKITVENVQVGPDGVVKGATIKRTH